MKSETVSTQSEWIETVPTKSDVNRFWCLFLFQYFGKEEQNFISANEIDNMTLIMPTSASRKATVVPDAIQQTSGKVVCQIDSLFIFIIDHEFPISRRPQSSPTRLLLEMQILVSFSTNCCCNFLN